MERKSINRYHSFCKSLDNLAEAKGKDSSDKFILSGTVQMFNLSFDLAWKVMKDLCSSIPVAGRYMRFLSMHYMNAIWVGIHSYIRIWGYCSQLPVPREVRNWFAKVIVTSLPMQSRLLNISNWMRQNVPLRRCQ